jgi:hypothetical protein
MNQQKMRTPSGLYCIANEIRPIPTHAPLIDSGDAGATFIN